MFLYLKHLLLSKGPDRVHSPFVFDLYFHVLRNKNKHYSFQAIEKKSESDKVISPQIIGESLFKIINKFKPKNTLYIGDYSTKNLRYLSEARKTTKSYLWKNAWGTDNVIQEEIKRRKNVYPVAELQSLQTDMLVIDTVSEHDFLPKIDIANYKYIFVTNIKDYKNCRRIWNRIVSEKKHNICIDCYYFGLCIQRPEQISEYFSLRL